MARGRTADRTADRRGQRAGGEDRRDPRRAGAARRGQHPAGLRQLEEPELKGGRPAARVRDPADPAVRLQQGKNATDMAMVIDAMDLLYARNARRLRHRLLRRRLHAAGDALRRGRPRSTASARRRRRSHSSTPARGSPTSRRWGSRGSSGRTSRRARPAPARSCAATRGWCRCCATRSSRRAGDDGWSHLGAVGQPDRQPGFVRPAQLRLPQAHRPDRGDRAVRARSARTRSCCRDKRRG